MAGGMTFPDGGVPTGRSVHCWPDVNTFERFIVGFYFRGLRGSRRWAIGAKRSAVQIASTMARPSGLRSCSGSSGSVGRTLCGQCWRATQVDVLGESESDG